eukprot:7382719-Prymnesium_polylepis.1
MSSIPRVSSVRSVALREAHAACEPPLPSHTTHYPRPLACPNERGGATPGLSTMKGGVYCDTVLDIILAGVYHFS